MNMSIFVWSFIPLTIGFVIYCIALQTKRRIDDGDTVEGTLVEYKRLKNPVITFIYNGEEYQLDLFAYKAPRLMKIGTKVRVLKVAEDQYISDYNVRLVKFYAFSFMISAVLIILASIFV